jgi:hypothetical protein
MKMKSSLLIFVSIVVAQSAFSITQAKDGSEKRVAPTSALSSESYMAHSTCNAVVLVKETDPRGLNVRAAPSIKSKVIGRIAPSEYDKDYEMVIFYPTRVYASENGWFLIDTSRDEPAYGEATDRKPFEGKGWISGKKLAVKSQANHGRAEPDVKAKVLFTDTFDGDESVKGSHALACKGKWVYAEYDYTKFKDVAPSDPLPEARVGGSPYRIRGWMNQLCDKEIPCQGLKDE